MARQKHTVEVVKHDIELDENLPLHEKGWVIQRIGWFFIFAMMLAGLIGVFGHGFVSRRSPVAGNFKVEYDRLFPYESEMKINIESGSEHISSISLPQDYIKNFRLIRFIPDPENNYTENNDVVYNFLPGENKIITLYVITQEYGSIQGTMTINKRNTIPLDHYIYP